MTYINYMLGCSFSTRLIPRSLVTAFINIWLMIIKHTFLIMAIVDKSLRQSLKLVFCVVVVVVVFVAVAYNKSLQRNAYTLLLRLSLNCEVWK